LAQDAVLRDIYDLNQLAPARSQLRREARLSGSQGSKADRIGVRVRGASKAKSPRSVPLSVVGEMYGEPYVSGI
jgi:hypothetical protein